MSWTVKIAGVSGTGKTTVMETHIVHDGYEVTESQPCESQLTKIV